MRARIMPMRLTPFFFCLLALLSLSAKNNFIYPEEENSVLAARYKDNALSSPVRIALDHGDLIYVTDFIKECVVVMKNIHKKITTIPINGNPLGVAVDDKGWIYVGNNSTNKVEVYAPGGRLKYSLEGEIKRPNDIAISSNGIIYVVVSDENLVKIFNPASDIHSRIDYRKKL